MNRIGESKYDLKKVIYVFEKTKKKIKWYQKMIKYYCSFFLAFDAKKNVIVIKKIYNFSALNYIYQHECKNKSILNIILIISIIVINQNHPKSKEI